MLIIDFIIKLVFLGNVVLSQLLGIDLTVKLFFDKSLSFLFSQQCLLLLLEVQESVEFLDSVPLVVFIDLRVVCLSFAVMTPDTLASNAWNTPADIIFVTSVQLVESLG
jgi:hypothetical protein